MKILFLVYHGFSEVSGISKKIRSQVKGLRENGHDVRVCYYTFLPDGRRCRFVDDEIIEDYGTGRLASLRRRFCYGSIFRYCIENGIELVYARAFMNAAPPIVRLFGRLRRAGIRAVTEIPTYPYDGEQAGFSLGNRFEFFIDRLCRRRLAARMNAIATFSDDKEIFGCRAINISNGVDLDSIPLHAYRPADDAVHLIGVAEVHYWHGFDRVIAGLGEYYSSGRAGRKVCFHIVGGIGEGEMYGTRHAPGFAGLIERYGLSEYVVFHGQMSGSVLDGVFDRCVFAIGSLARHRSGVSSIKTLKNREYATRGIPFIYSENDSDFDGKEYVMKAPADESPVDIGKILGFIDSHAFQPAEIRKSVEHLSWREQMRIVVEEAMKD